MRLKFQVDTIVCGSCAGIIESILQDDPDLISTNIDVSEKTLHITCPDDYEPQRIIEQLDDIGHEAVLVQEDAVTKSSKKIIYYLMMGLIATLTGGILMFLHSLPAMPFVFFPALCAGVAIPGIIIGGFWIFKNAYVSIFKQKHLTMDVLFALSLGIIILSSLASFFVPVLGLPMMCHTGLMIVGFRNLGKFLNEHMSQTVNSKTKHHIPFSKQYELTTGEHVTKEDIQAKNQIKLSKGQFIPCDGIILSGSAVLNEKRMTGELGAASKTVNQQVFAGTLIESGEVTIEAQQPFAQSIYQTNQTLISNALTQSSSLQTTTNRIVQIYLPTLLALATVSALVIACFNPLNALVTFTGILVGACPCVLGLVTPLTTKLAFDKAKQRNIIIKDHEAFEKLMEVDTFVFDKTGTITDLSFQSIQSLDDEHELAFLQQIARSLEEDCCHPIADEITKALGDTTRLNVSDIQSTGYSRSGLINSTRYHIGGIELLQTLKQPIPIDLESGITPIFICTDSECLGYISLQETLRPNSQAFIDHLKQLGKQIILLTGSDSPVVQEIADDIGVHTVHTNQKPTDKIQFIQNLQESGHVVAMIGDGDNDESALAASDVNISFEDADHAARNQANIILPKHAPFNRLAELYQLSKRTTQNIKQSIGLTLLIGLMSVALSLTMVTFVGMAMSPALMAGLMFLQVGAVLLNVYKIKWSSIEPPAYRQQQEATASVNTVTVEVDSEHDHELNLVPQSNIYNRNLSELRVRM